MAHRTRWLVFVLMMGLAAVAAPGASPCAAGAPVAATSSPRHDDDTRADPATTGRVRGRIVDSRTGQALGRVRVEISARQAAGRAGSPSPSPLSVLTDASGHFELEVSPGPATLTVSVVGYVLARRDLLVDANAPVEITIPLTEGTGSYTEEVRVLGERFPRIARGVPMEQTLGSADLQNLKSTLADDPLRALQTLPGVASTDDFKSEFIVRGSDFRHVGVTLDGVPSPLLLHTVHSVSDSGSIAMINSDILDSVTLQSGSYPQRFGNRIGASVEFRTREGSRDRPHVRFSASAINVSGVAEGPIGRTHRGSWLISARKSYMDWLVQRIDPSITGTFGFVDGQGTLVYDLSPSQTVQVSVVAGRSRFNERDLSRGLNSLDVGLNRAVLVNASLRSTFSPRLIVTQRVYGVRGRFRNLNPDGFEIARGDQRDVSYRADVTNAIRDHVLIEAGGHVQWLRDYGSDAVFDDRGQMFWRGFDASGNWQSAYGQVRWEPRPFLTITPGARVDHWSRIDETHASPWVQAEIGLPRSFLLGVGTGLFRQSPDLDQIVGPRGSLAAQSERAWHGDVGIGQRLGAWRWQATAYVRDETNVLRLPDIEPRVVDGRFAPESFVTRWENTLSGSSRGVELFAHRRSTNGLSGWIGYSYASTHYHDARRDERYVADVDQRHTLNLYGSYRLSDRTSVSGRFRVGSNVPIVGYYRETGGDRFFLSAERNTVRLPTYSRLDLRGARTYALSGGRLTLFVEVINVFNQANVRATTARINVRSLEAFGVMERMFPILPSAGITVEF